jgi:hypothetical protein
MASLSSFRFQRRGTWIERDRYRGSDDSQPGNYHGVQIRMVAGFIEITETKESSLAAA